MRISQFIDRLSERLGRRAVIGFLGLGISNIALLSNMPNSPTVIRCKGAEELSRLPPGLIPMRAYLGEYILEDIREDAIFISPSIRRDVRGLEAASLRGCILTSDAELFFSDRPENIYAVTGSDGKSTTTALIARLLSERYPECEPLGNIGVPFSLSRGGCAAVELSSFQLSYLKPHSRAAVITPISPNHLNWHKDLCEYIDAKLNVFENTSRRIITPDTPISARIAERTEAYAVYSIAFTEAELRERYRAENYITLHEEEIILDGAPLVSIAGAKRRERHNIHNLMGAVAATLGECSRDHILSVIESFEGLEHRMERFLSVSGIDFINSSIDTSPARTASTLTSLGKRVRLILGGRGKGLSLSPALAAIRQYAERISLYGEAREEYSRTLAESGISARSFGSLAEAIEDALEGISENGTLLLSPAATGYGEFRDYAERGRYFKDYIKDKYKTQICERTEK